MRFTVRNATPRDAEQMVALDRALAVDGRGMVLDLEQIAAAEGRRAELELIALGRGDTVVLVAEEGGAVLGEARLTQLRPARLAHVGLLSLGVHPEHQRRGVGRALTKATIERASAMGLVRLELYVRADNERAIALYRSCGFEHEGTRARFVRLPDGTFVDDLTMVRFLDR